VTDIPPDTGIALTHCDREPIHIPGSIQPHGALLSLAGGRVAQASANAQEWLGAAPEALLGRSLADVFGEEGAARIRQALEMDDPREANPVRLEAGGRALDGLVHRHDGIAVVEVEAASEQGAAEARASVATFRRGLVEVQRARSVRSLCDSIARSVRELTGYDRVLVYRFHEDWHGEVLAEAREESLEPFLELHYPPSDIPVQARALYRLNWLRNIPDREYRPVPLVPAAHPDTGRPLDMGLAALRSVAPVHVQYLRNMGVAATLTISLLRDGELWGLIACHHQAPRSLPYELRASCELLGQLFSARIDAAEAEEHRGADLRRAETLAALTDRLAGTRDWAAGLARDPALLELVDATGAAVVADGRVEVAGDAPLPRAVEELAARLAEHPLPGGLVATDHARDELPGTEASGVLAVPLSDARRQWVLWFRPEVVQSVNWAGDPRKPMEAVADGEKEVRLTPRGSFALWKETVRGRSRPWTAGDRRAALDLRRVVAEVVLRHAEEIAELNRALARSNQELDAFTYIASHDLREPLRGIRNYAGMLREDHAAQLDEEGMGLLDTLTRLTSRMDGLVESLFEYSRVGRMEMEVVPTDLGEVLDDVLHSLAHQVKEAGVEIRVPRPLPTLPCDAVRVGQVFQNLVHNAIKYNDRPGAWVEIGWRQEPGGPAALYVRDNGIGIAEQHHEVIFRLYKRLHPRDRFGGGTGVGLTIVRRIVERHGGRIWLESAPESGTTFFFTLQPG
jgi:light-regulated signal transduction histidine kinase (bacteriophytochrome)